jgi:hypothetical protein
VSVVIAIPTKEPSVPGAIFDLPTKPPVAMNFTKK